MELFCLYVWTVKLVNIFHYSYILVRFFWLIMWQDHHGNTELQLQAGES